MSNLKIYYTYNNIMHLKHDGQSLRTSSFKPIICKQYMYNNTHPSQTKIYNYLKT